MKVPPMRACPTCGEKRPEKLHEMLQEKYEEGVKIGMSLGREDHDKENVKLSAAIIRKMLK